MNPPYTKYTTVSTIMRPHRPADITNMSLLPVRRKWFEISARISALGTAHHGKYSAKKYTVEFNFKPYKRA